MFSSQPREVPHRGQWLEGQSTDSSRGTLQTTTLRKLPTQAPRSAATRIGSAPGQGGENGGTAKGVGSKASGGWGNQARDFFSSIMRWMMGVRINSMAKPILPPLTTMLVGLLMKES